MERIVFNEALLPFIERLGWSVDWPALLQELARIVGRTAVQTVVPRHINRDSLERLLRRVHRQAQRDLNL